MIDNNCGISIDELASPSEWPNFKIYNGYEAERLRFPWTVKTRDIKLGPETYIDLHGDVQLLKVLIEGSGILIGPKVLLTASHNIKDKGNLENMTVYGGGTNWEDNEVDKWTARPTRVIADGRTDSGMYVDLAIVELDREIENTSPVCLLGADHKPPFNWDHNYLRFSGYGKPHKNNLHWMDFKLEPSETVITDPDDGTQWSCSYTYNYLCSKAGDAGICKGDSGGGWTFRRRDPSLNNSWRWYVFGIATTSEKEGCKSNKRDIFVNLAVTRNWICNKTTGIC